MNSWILLLICITVPIVLYLAWRLNEKEAEKLLRKLFDDIWKETYLKKKASNLLQSFSWRSTPHFG